MAVNHRVGGSNPSRAAFIKWGSNPIGRDNSLKNYPVWVQVPPSLLAYAGSEALVRNDAFSETGFAAWLSRA